MNKDVLIEVIQHLSRFDEQRAGEPYTLQEFVGYLNAQAGVEQIAMRKVEGERVEEVHQVRVDNNSDISILITLMFRYAKGYIKKALHESPIQTADEFAFLITLVTFHSLTKTELITKQVMEKTSGVEVIKRLVAQGMIAEFADDADKRSVRVAITDKGRMELMRVLPEMGKVSKIVVGNLTPTEINTLGYLLKKLDFFHNDIFLNKKGVSLEEVLRLVDR